MSRVDEIKKMLKTDPKDSFLTYALALEYEKAKAPKEAIKIIESLIQDDPDYLGAYYKLGQLYEGQDKLAKARKIYATGIGLADEKQDNKAKGELEEALWLIEEE
ncbi:MAG: tetratricopeptide repeat protein [Vicingaceae bacterium]